MFDILSKAKFSSLRRSCLENCNKFGGVTLPSDLKSNIAATQDLDNLFDVLCDTPYWNWMNIKMLTKMARASHMKAATKLIQQYKDEVFSRKLVEVLQQIPSFNISSNYYTKAKEKWNKNLNDITVNDLVNHWSEVEKIFNVEEPTVLLDSIISGSVEIHWLIPTELFDHIIQSISNQISRMAECNILYFNIAGHVIKLPSITEPDTLSTTSSMLLYTYSIYYVSVFIVESASSSSPTTSKLTESVTKLPTIKSPYIGGGSHGVTQVGILVYLYRLMTCFIYVCMR